ncbi:MAG: hypothetical protein A3G41_04260 [Elusimicrobia bacterium RIFCSPLOWO2_12_FULL_59_9]|nr:MAG: hypothetical protein A3G41_04260 [Elusimicrobia bacterium RIFCSPLOWO2_12_FULL_59_9]
MASESEVPMIRLGFVFPDLISGKGVERYSLEVVRFLATKFEVHVFANRWESLPESVHLHKVWAIGQPYFLRLLSFGLAARCSIDSRLLDIVSVQSCCAFTADLVTAHSCHKAYVDFCKTMGWWERLRKALNPFHYVALFFWSRLLSPPDSPYVIAVSERVRRELIIQYRLPEDRVLTIPPGVDLVRFNYTNRFELRSEQRRVFGFREDDFVVVFVGNEFRRKGLEFLLDALVHVRDPKIRLLVVGQPDSLTRIQYRILTLRKGISGRVKFVGRQSRMEAVYAASDLFVFPSLYEAFSAVILEAASSGLPVLATNVGGVEEFLVDGYNGWFIRRGGRDIAARIERLAENRELLRMTGENARKSVTPYAWDVIRERLIEAYQMVACRKGDRLSLGSAGSEAVISRTQEK